MKAIINHFLSYFGYKICRTELNSQLLGVNPWNDIKFFLKDSHYPICLDVGANVGQTIQTMRRFFPESVIHSFEPSSKAFDTLLHTFKLTQNVYLVNKALGSSKGSGKFYECDKHTDLSSLLEAPQLQVSTYDVEIISLDEYCPEYQINKIDLLKIDVQGFDLEVLKGGKEILQKTQLILVEVMFRNIYTGAPTLSQIYDYITERNFYLHAFYRPHYRGYRASYLDALFINKSYFLELEQ